MVLRPRQHNIGYSADGFYRSDDSTNSVKALKGGGLVIQTGLSLTRLTSLWSTMITVTEPLPLERGIICQH